MEKKNFTTLDLVHCGLFTALIAIGAFIKIMIPLGVFEVTFSLQFLFALLAGMLIGARKGFMSVLSYIIIGLMGIPIFAHGGGLAYLMKPTFGFIIGFACASLVAGLTIGKDKNPSLKKLILAGFLGEMAYYLSGLVYYYVSFNFLLGKAQGIGIVELISVWFLSTVVPDFILAVIAAAIAKRTLPILEKIN